MALRAFLMTMMLATAVTPALADVYRVGDNFGWNIGVNFTSWAEEYGFRVRDSLMFMYPPIVHNVIEVNASEFKTCTYSKEASKIFTSGNDTIPLDSPGKKWYISGVLVDCRLGMKLVISVSAVEGPSPSPAPMLGSSTPPPPSTITASAPPPPSTSAAGEVSYHKSCGLLVALTAAYIIMA